MNKARDAQKKLLIAESELNRALLVRDASVAVASFHRLTHHIKSRGLWAMLAAVVTSRFLGPKKNAPSDPSQKRSWFSKLISGIKTGASIWSLLSPGSSAPDEGSEAGK
jgi:hypothetical protein